MTLHTHSGALSECRPWTSKFKFTISTTARELQARRFLAKTQNFKDEQGSTLVVFTFFVGVHNELWWPEWVVQWLSVCLVWGRGSIPGCVRR